MASTILWRNLALVTETASAEGGGPDDAEDLAAEGHGEGGHTVFVYMRRGAVIEVHPATGVRLTDDCVEVVNEKQVVAAYPRERVVLASSHLIEPVPFG
jgi:hypothetical protein